MRLTSQNKWKYTTIGLMAVLAVGFSFPQAFAHVTTSLTHNVQHILTAISALQSEVDGLESDIEALADGVENIDSKIEATSNVKSFTTVLDASNDEFVILEASSSVSAAVVSGTVRFEASGVTENDTNLTFLCDSGGEGSLQDGQYEYHVSCEKIWIQVSGLTDDSVTITGTAVYDVDPA
jgi:hypothetical protein